ncbi:MAG: hypothetical protein QXK88_04975 [Desulfurococcaceae archaeon]
MSQLQSSVSKYFQPLKLYAPAYSALLLYSALISVFYFYKAQLIPQYLAIAVLFALLNAVMALRKLIAHYIPVTLYTLTALVYMLSSQMLGGLEGLLEDAVDALLIITLLFTYAYCNYPRDLQGAIRLYIPFIVLVSTIIGIYLGVERPLRFSLLTLIDLLASIAVSLDSRAPLRYASPLLFFFLLYTSPIVNVKAASLILFSLLHLTRNKLILSNSHKHINYANAVLSLDLLIKPIAVSLI